MFLTASVCLFVCQHDNFRMCKHRMMKLGARRIEQKSRWSSNFGPQPRHRLDAQLPKMWHFAESRRMTQNVNKCKQSHVGRETSHRTQCARKTGVWLPCWENQRRLSSLDVSPTWLILMYSLLFNVFICAFRQCCELKIEKCRKFIVSRRVSTVLPLR